MNAPYEEILEGESLLRSIPGARHEAICDRLHAQVGASLAHLKVARLLARRSPVELRPGTLLRPDLALVTAATNKLFLAAEIICPGDHHADTVLKKHLYETARVPRLWMVDPRYDNVEIYHGGPHGLTLQGILASRELLTEALLPGLQFTVIELFGLPPARPMGGSARAQ